MENIKTEVKGDKLTITIDLKARLGESRSGKSMLIAKTGGNIPLPGKTECMFNVNVFIPNT